MALAYIWDVHVEEKTQIFFLIGATSPKETEKTAVFPFSFNSRKPTTTRMHCVSWALLCRDTEFVLKQ